MRTDPKSFPNSVRDAVQELWGMGYAVVPLLSLTELLDLPKPRTGMSYQWHDKPTLDGWKAVPCSRHPGLFAPLGSSDDICVHHLYLLERPKAETDAALQAARDKAKKNVDDWFGRQADHGLSGTVTVLGESGSHRTAEVTEIGERQSLRTKVPPEMFEHLAELLRERDRLLVAMQEESVISIEQLPSARETCLRVAIENIRTKYAAPAATEATNG
jgi:hypothetical protein